MGRKTINESKKHKPISVSLPPHQIAFLKQNIDFDFSKFVQLHLTEHISRLKHVPIICHDLPLKNSSMETVLENAKSKSGNN